MLLICKTAHRFEYYKFHPIILSFRKVSYEIHCESQVGRTSSFPFTRFPRASKSAPCIRCCQRSMSLSSVTLERDRRTPRRRRRLANDPLRETARPRSPRSSPRRTAGTRAPVSRESRVTCRSPRIGHQVDRSSRARIRTRARSARAGRRRLGLGAARTRRAVRATETRDEARTRRGGHVLVSPPERQPCHRRRR